MTSSYPRRFRSYERLEQRFCLSVVTFVKDSPRPALDTDVEILSSSLADLDGDDDADLIVGGTAIYWFENSDSREHFATPGRRIDDAEATFLCCGVNLPVDLDLDGDHDLVSIQPSNNRLTTHFVWHENLDGRGSFGHPRQIADGSNAMRVLVGDLDEDGAPDLVVSREYRIDVFLNTGRSVEFTSTTITESGSHVLELSDVDADDDLDIVFWREEFESALLVATSNGDGTFSDPVRIAQSAELQDQILRSLDSADIDGDGDFDLVTVIADDTFPSAGFRSRILWLENVGPNGTYTTHTIVEANGDQSIQTADIDGDGDVDIVSGSCATDVDCGRSRLSWHENIGGNRQFAPLRHIDFVKDPVFTVADFDGDSDVDLLTVTDSSSSLVFHENRVVGDSNNDGLFDSSDLIAVFVAGKYEDGIPGNASFDDGDWNQDDDFDSADLVVAFSAGNYFRAATPTASQIAAAVEWLFAQDNDKRRPRA